jgi:hypothetical protein
MIDSGECVGKSTDPSKISILSGKKTAGFIESRIIFGAINNPGKKFPTMCIGFSYFPA